MPKSLVGIPERFAIEMINRNWILRNTLIWHKPNAMPSSVKDRFTVDFEYVYFFVKNKKYYFEQQFDAHKQISLERVKRPYNKYESLYNESKHRQGMNKKRGENLIEKRTLPSQNKFVDTLRKNFTINQIVNKTKLSRTLVEHWFRYDNEGFAYPSKEDWAKLETDLFPELLKVQYVTDEIKSNVKGKNKRTVWTITTKAFSEAHFAVYPPDLIEIPIKAGCPEYICKKCGKYRKKIYKKGERIITGGTRKKRYSKHRQ